MPFVTRIALVYKRNKLGGGENDISGDFTMHRCGLCMCLLLVSCFVLGQDTEVTGDGGYDSEYEYTG